EVAARVVAEEASVERRACAHGRVRAVVVPGLVGGQRMPVRRVAVIEAGEVDADAVRHPDGMCAGLAVRCDRAKRTDERDGDWSAAFQRPRTGAFRWHGGGLLLESGGSAKKA